MVEIEIGNSSYLGIARQCFKNRTPVNSGYWYYKQEFGNFPNDNSSKLIDIKFYDMKILAIASFFGRNSLPTK
jgi:hypothetical protein